MPKKLWAKSKRCCVVEITAIFFDIGGVLLTNGWDRHSRKAAVERFSLEWEEFEDRHELVLDAFEKGEITLDAYLKRVVFYRERPFTEDQFRDFMFAQSRELPGSLDFLGGLAREKRYFLAALSNESAEINEYRIDKFHLRDYLEAFFSSCYLGVRKPHAEIYRRALNISHRSPEESIFIDDRGLNLECARELGMRTIQFKNLQQLREALENHGVHTGQKNESRKLQEAR
jgi:putative hydrolase of the HAD superfamily